MSQFASRAQGRKRKQSGQSKQHTESALLITTPVSVASEESHTKRRKILVTPGSNIGKSTSRASKADIEPNPKQIFTQLDFYFIQGDYMGSDRGLIDKCIAKGAVWSYNWHRAVTHAIAIDPVADDRSIREWYDQTERYGTPVVRSDWLLACCELDYVVRPLPAHILICPEHNAEASLRSPSRVVLHKDRVDNAFNPFHNLPNAKHDDETVDEFLNRLQPAHYLDGQDVRRIRVAYPQAFTPEDDVKTGAFTRAGREILRQYDSLVEQKYIEKPGWSVRRVRDSLFDQRDQLLRRIDDAAHIYDIHFGKWMLFDLEGAIITGFWNDIVRETLAGSLGSSAEVMQRGKDGMFTIGVGVAKREDLRGVTSKIFDLRKRHSVVMNSPPRFKPEALSLLGLNSGNHYKIKTSTRPEYPDLFLESNTPDRIEI